MPMAVCDPVPAAAELADPAMGVAATASN